MTDDIVARLRAPAKADVPIRICRLMDESADTIEYERALRAQAEQEHTDMAWQRRRADERAEAAEAQNILLERQRDEANAYGDEEHRRALAAEARVRELEAENKRLAERLDLLAVGFGVPDGGRYIADWQTKIDKLKAAERALAEAYERAGDDAYLLCGYDGNLFGRCWGSEMRSRVRELEAELDGVASAMPVRFMDLPDGGNPTLGEQVSRMRHALEAAERAIAGAYERAAKVAESSMASKNLADRSPAHIAAAIRDLAQEES